MSTNGSTPKSGLKKTALSSKLKTVLLSLITVFGTSCFDPKPLSSADFSQERRRMVTFQLRGRGIHDTAVLDTMGKVPRHLFVEKEFTHLAYSDSALPIKKNQTISQPYVVALMTQSAQLKISDVVLEIGTGSGYQAAVLSHLVKQVYTIEIIKLLAQDARDRFKKIGYNNIEVRNGDGYQGWKEHAPFDAILITAAAPKIPKPLIKQLKIGGRMVLPLGKVNQSQELIILTKQPDGKLKETSKGGVIFVPMMGEVQKGSHL